MSRIPLDGKERRQSKPPRSLRLPARRRAYLPVLEFLETRTLPSFTAAVPYNTAPKPNGVAVGDFNNDGAPDLVTVNTAPTSSVSVLLGNGDGTFRPAQNYPVGNNPYAVAVADLNGDHNLDLVVTNHDSNTVSVLLGNGDGTFRPAVSYSAGQTPLALALGDFNGDGKPDIVVTNDYPSDRVTVLLNNGDGSFQSGASYGTGWHPYSVAVGDFDRDGKLDIMTSEFLERGVRWFRGHGDGTFDPGVFSQTQVAVGLAAADFNEDGILDVATGGGSFNAALAVAPGNGNGTFQTARTFAAENGISKVAAADVNGDGHADLIALSPVTENFSVLYGHGDFTFQNAFTFLAGPAHGANPVDFAVGDFDGDGYPDLAVVDQNFNYVSILLDRPAVTHLRVTAPASTVAGAPVNVTVTAADAGDVPAPHYRGTVHFSASDPSLLLPSDYTFTAADQGSHVFALSPTRAGDVTITVTDIGDGSIDGRATVTVVPAATSNFLVTGFPSPATAGVAGSLTVIARDAFGNTTTAYRGTVRFSSSDSQAALPGNYTFSASDNGTATVLATLRTAGSQSLTATDVSNSTVSGSQTGIVVEPAGASQLSATAPGSVAPGERFRLTVTLRDPFNNIATDYRGTVLISSSDPRYPGPGAYTFTAADAGVHVFAVALPTAGNQTITVSDANDSHISGTVTVAVIIPPLFGPPVDLNAGARPRAVAVGDFNGDGFADIVSVNENGNDFSVMLGLGDGTFLNAVNYATGGQTPTHVVAADFNGDGIEDLVITNQGSNTVSVLLGNGDGRFRPPVTYAVGSRPTTVAAADLTGSGFLDLAVANYGSNNVSVLLGNGDGTFRAGGVYAVGGSPWWVAAGDVDGDGVPDLVTSNESVTVSVLHGNGDGTFGPAVNLAAGGTGPRAVALADLNGDGNLDLVTANYDSGTVSVYLGRGDGTFLTAANYSARSGPQSMLLADVNGDGNLDIVTANQIGGVSVLLGFGDGTFEPLVSYPAGVTPLGVALGDFNGDAAPDLAVANGSSNNVSVLFHQGGAPAGPAHAGPLPAIRFQFPGDPLPGPTVAAAPPGMLLSPNRPSPGVAPNPNETGGAAPGADLTESGGPGDSIPWPWLFPELVRCSQRLPFSPDMEDGILGALLNE